MGLGSYLYCLPCRFCSLAKLLEGLRCHVAVRQPRSRLKQRAGQDLWFLTLDYPLAGVPCARSLASSCQVVPGLDGAPDDLFGNCALPALVQAAMHSR